MELNDLYRDVILDHNRRPRNFGPLEAADASVEGFNPLCGDRLMLRLKLAADRIADIRFEGQGCAISTASASLMTEAVKGKTREEALELFHRVHHLLTDDAPAGEPGAGEDLGKLAALSGVREFPARVKCASLCWHTLAAALQSREPRTLPQVSTE
jgi:nitrogen fixation protein NifU and related proteins